MQEGWDCGGGYLKLLTHPYDPNKFNNKTPYTIMFGPDKCGMDSKVHFIIRHKNPKTGEFEEKHLTAPPTPKSDTITHLCGCLRFFFVCFSSFSFVWAVTTKFLSPNDRL